MSDESAEIQGEEPLENTGEAANPESAPESEDTSAEQPEEKKPRGVQKRIDELTANWREEQRQNEQLRQQLFQMQQGMMSQRQEPQQPEPAPQPQGEPQLDQFQSYEQYVAALAEFKADQKFKEWQSQQTQQQRQSEVQAQDVQFQARAAEFAAEHPDYQTVANNPYLPVSEAMAEVIRVSEAGPQLLYQLGQNPNEAARIAALPPAQAAMELGRMEVRMNTPQPRTQTNAPDPIQPTGGGGGSQGVDPETMTPDQWLEWRNNQLRSQ